MTILSDPTGGGVRTQKRLDPDKTVVWVPPKALTEIPPSPAFRFLGHPGSRSTSCLRLFSAPMFTVRLTLTCG